MKSRLLFLISIIIILVVAVVVYWPSNIDWVDFIKFNDIEYFRKYDSVFIPEQDLYYFDKIQFKVADNVGNFYRFRNGDAAYLEKGTIIYSIKDYSPAFRLITGQGELYEAGTNPHAKKGADLLDIGGKVEYIGINSSVDGETELASIKDNNQVSDLVEMVLNAPVNQNSKEHGSLQYFIVFYLKDGTTVSRSYWLDTGELSRGILLPDEFGQAVKAVLQ
jgi:hypothetical protein